MNITYTTDVQHKQEEIRDAKRQLREITKDMVNLRKQNQILRQENQQLPDLFHRIQILQKCLRDELIRKDNESSLYEQHYSLQQQNGALSMEGNISKHNNMNMGHRYVSVDHLQEDVAHLRARLAAKEDIEQQLREELLTLKSSRSTMEQQCKRIIAQCCNIPIEGVETVLSPLLHAVESDDSLADISEVAAFMSRVKQQDLMMKNVV